MLPLSTNFKSTRNTRNISLCCSLPTNPIILLHFCEAIDVFKNSSLMLELEEGEVNFTRPNFPYGVRDKDGKKIWMKETISYYHCGPKLNHSTVTTIDTEIVLLHGFSIYKRGLEDEFYLTELLLERQ